MSKRQRKLEEMMIGNSCTAKKNKLTTDDTPIDKKQKSVDTSKATIVKEISNDDLELLRQFDLNMTFGPCTGIPRIQRYERAIRHELDPPVRVLELINLYPNDRQVTHCIWRDYTL